MNRGIRVLLAMLVVVLLGCSAALAQDVRTNYMPGTDFTRFHTYKWVAIEGSARPDQILDQQIRNAIDAQLAAKGLTKTEDEKADLYIDYQVSVNKETQWNAYGMGPGLRWGGMGTATSSTINVGTLALDMYDPANKQLVWTGRATKTLDPSKNPQKNAERLNKAMQKLLKDYPPKQK